MEVVAIFHRLLAFDIAPTVQFQRTTTFSLGGLNKTGKTQVTVVQFETSNEDNGKIIFV